MSTAAPEDCVHVIPQRDDQELRATVSEFRGAPYISLRVYWRSPDGWVATRKGITVPASRLPELETAVAALRRAVEAHAQRRSA